MMDRVSQIINMDYDFLKKQDFAQEFRLMIQEDLTNLVGIPRLSMGPAIDENTIQKLNKIMSSEEKTRFLTDVINFKNINFNTYYLILHSSYEVRHFLKELISISTFFTPLNHHYYDIANIYLYILANSETPAWVDVLTPLKNGMRMYNCTKLTPILNIPQDNIVNGMDMENNILDLLELKTDEQLEHNKDCFYKQVEEQEQENREIRQKNMLKIMGISLICQIALSAFGLPPLSRILTKTITNILNIDN